MNLSYISVTKASHPKIMEAFFTMAHDVGATTTMDLPFPNKFFILDSYDLNKIENTLAALLEDEFEEFTIGDCNIRDQMMESNPNLNEVDNLLFSFYRFYIEEDEENIEIAIPIGAR
jgi:hypothetical protein